MSIKSQIIFFLYSLFFALRGLERTFGRGQKKNSERLRSFVYGRKLKIFALIP